MGIDGDRQGEAHTYFIDISGKFEGGQLSGLVHKS